MLSENIHKIKVLFLLAVFVFLVIPKNSIHQLMGHNHSSVHFSKNIELSQNHETQFCDFEKFHGNDFFCFYKIPQLQDVIRLCSIKLYLFHGCDIYHKIFVYINLLRGPPLS